MEIFAGQMVVLLVNRMNFQEKYKNWVGANEVAQKF